MSLFSRKPEKRVSLDQFKASAGDASVADQLSKITGGRLADCHGGTRVA